LNIELNPIFQSQNNVVHIFGQPGTYKTAFLVQIIWKKLKEGIKQIFLVDVSGNFPYVKLKPIEPLLTKLIVFQPKSLREEVTILDDLELKGISEETILLIDDIFHRIIPEEESHLESYLLAVIQLLTHQIEFPIFITNEGRGFNDRIQPLRSTLMKKYFKEHLFFQKSVKKDVVQIFKMVDEDYQQLTELSVDKSGLFPEMF
jgi:hypothetical protein